MGPAGLLATPAPINHPAGQVEAELEVALETQLVAAPPGGSATIGLVMTNWTSDQIRGELQLLSPVETWPYVSPWAMGFALGPVSANGPKRWCAAPKTPGSSRGRCSR